MSFLKQNGPHDPWGPLGAPLVGQQGAPLDLGMQAAAQQGPLSYAYQSMLQNAQVANQQNMANQAAQMGISNGQSPYAVKKIPALRTDDLNADAMQVPLDTMADIWSAKFAVKWVGEDEIIALAEEDATWKVFFHRLIARNRLEKLYMTDTGHNVYRLLTD